MGVVAAILWIGNLALGDSLGFGYLRNEVLWYSNIALAAVVVCAFAPLRRKGALARIDNFVGELAYPIFLVHLAVGCVLYHWLPDLAGPAFWFSLGLSTLIVSWLIARGADFAVEPLRTQIRATHNVTAQSSVVA
jgi:peptidoglycan/LPS O-acetylase OafA/YrhL